MDQPSLPPAARAPCSCLEQKLVLYDTLQHPDAIRWAADGRLAVLLANQVEICQYVGEEVEPYFRYRIILPGGRQQGDRVPVDVGVMKADGMYQDRDAMVYVLGRSSAEAASGDDLSPMFCGLDWSPRACAWEGGCLLATLSTDARVEVWEPPRSTRACSWVRAEDVTDVWACYLKRHGYLAPGMKHNKVLHALLRGAEEEERREGGSMRDPQKWAARQHMVAVEALAWAKVRGRGRPGPRGQDGEDGGGGKKGGEGSFREIECALLATGGPRVLTVWGFWDQGEGKSYGLNWEGEEGGKEGGPAPLLVTDVVADISQVAWMAPNRRRGEAEARGEGGMLLAVGTALGSVHLLLVVQPARGEGGREGGRGNGVGVLAAAKNTQLHVWTVPEGKPVEVEGSEGAKEGGAGHVELVTGLDWGHAPDGSGPHLLSAGLDGRVCVWRFHQEGGGGGEGCGGRERRDGRGPEGHGHGEGERPSEPLQVLGPSAWRLGMAYDLMSLIPTRPGMLMGLAVSPGPSLLLGLARAVEGDGSNRRLLQFNRKLKKNHAEIAIRPMWQTGWSTVVLPATGRVLWKRLEGGGGRGGGGSPMDLVVTASMDTEALMQGQVHPDFWAPEGTGGRGEREANGGGEGRREGGRGGGREGRMQWQVAVDTSNLPENSLDVLAHSAFQRLLRLLDEGKDEGGREGRKKGGREGGMDRPPSVWHALHAMCTHMSRKFFGEAIGYLEEYARLLLMARIHLTAAYVDRSFEKLLAGEGGRRRIFSRAERQIARAMTRWVRANLVFLQELDRPQDSGGVTWESLAGQVEALSGQPEGGNEGGEEEEEERCVICDGAMLSDEMRNSTGTCVRGHAVGRCMETFMLIRSSEVWECPLCNSMAAPSRASLGQEGERFENETSTGVLLERPSWLKPWHTRGMTCLYCNVPCRLANT